MGMRDEDKNGICDICNQQHPGSGTCDEGKIPENIAEELLAALRKETYGGLETENDMISTFNNTYKMAKSVDFFIKGIPYVFMTCPVLNLCETNVKSDSFLTYLATSTDENKEILRHLTNGQFTDKIYEKIGSKAQCNHSLIPLVTNTALSVDIKDTVARTKEVGETFYGYKQVHPGSLVDSIVGDEISIKYFEMSNLPIIKMHKAWQDYIEKVRRGVFIPSKLALEDGFIDYMSSIYYILCDFDGETIKYWAKYTGVAPLNVPYSSLGGDFNSHEVPDITINYSYCYKEDMSVSILMDFNRVCRDIDTTNLKWGMQNIEGASGDEGGYENSSIMDKIPNNRADFEKYQPPKDGHPIIVAVDNSDNGNTGTDVGYYFKLKFNSTNKNNESTKPIVQTYKFSSGNSELPTQFV